jgi:hypothetical protein
MQPHNVENPRPGPGNDNGPKQRATAFVLIVIVVGLMAAISVNLVNRL